MEVAMSNFLRTGSRAFLIAVAVSVASGAEAVTYRSLTCEYVAHLVQYDTVRSIRLTNTGATTVPLRATYTVSRPTFIQGKQVPTYRLHLGRSLAPKQQGAATVHFDWPSPSTCRASAFWVTASEEVH
jgi:hypothetical protein